MTASPPAAAALLLMQDIHKSYPAVQALRGVDLELQGGEVLALLGENGAGKSTLIKVLAGAVIPERGIIRIGGRAVVMRGPGAAQRAGVAVIYQELNIVPGLSARENIFLGKESSRLGFLKHRDERRRARELFGRLGIDINPEAPCRDLSIAQQQAVEIARALAAEAKILVMDEPSAALTPHEVNRLLAIVRELKAQGIGIIYITHRLDEVFAIADRVTVLRDGQHIVTRPLGEVSRERLIEWMVGRPLEREYPTRSVQPGEVLLRVSGLCRGSKVRDVSFDLRQGEVVGLAGLVGAGRTETARLLFGADRADAGTIELAGRAVALRSPRDAIQHGIALLSEDRKNQGLVLGLPVRENIALPSLPALSRLGFVEARRERAEAEKFVRRLDVAVPHVDQLARFLSGGNQQKVVLAKWLLTDARVLLFDEPTRGIDVGARYEIYCLINELAEQGKAILLISSELPEVLGMSDRILVMHGGRITGEISDARQATQEQVLELAVR